MGPYDPQDPTEEIVVKAYYQWVPFMLFLQACMFYGPHLLYKLAEGGKVRNILGSIHLFVLDKEKRSGAVGDLAKYFAETQGIHNSWGVGILLTKTVYLANVVAQIFFTNMFLGYEFTRYGAQVSSFLEIGDKDRMDPMSRVFPRVTKCTFHKFGPSGSIQRHDAQCILPINIINEKIYVFLWFWFIFLAVLTAVDLLVTVGQAVLPSVRWLVLTRKLRLVPKFKSEELRAKIDVRLILRDLQFGDWQLMYAIIVNMDGITYAEWLEALTQQARDKEELKGADRAPLLQQQRFLAQAT